MIRRVGRRVRRGPLARARVSLTSADLREAPVLTIEEEEPEVVESEEEEVEFDEEEAPPIVEKKLGK